MKALFIGGTGTISNEVSKLTSKNGWELYILNRGNKSSKVPEGVKVLIADINNEVEVARLIKGIEFDVIADFIAFEPSQIQRDIRLFSKKTKQFIFISSASAYQKPLAFYKITESTPLSNPYWKYARDKIACEELLMSEYRNNSFPITIIRPSHTYGESNVPVAVQGEKGFFQVIDRIRKGKPVIVPGDGNSLWTITHNTDFAKAFVGIMGNQASIGEAIHITSDESITWNKIYDLIGDALNVKVIKYHVSTDFLVKVQKDIEGGLIGDKANTVVFDNSKIKRLVPEYVATTRFDQGVKKSIKYILAHPQLQIEDEEFDKFCDNVIKSQEEAVEFFKNI
ncbi:SDR family oxidoreductase [Clostridium lacusfryxellense]|uniref:SDR family oxidoreductase n=1 Tax=Clostridium lacusfryxellense TaxID=205328 RepID=UPI001C0CF7B5|nr:SDR family oxidoreductase [Clostridium lacusfryxellense]MBU3112182.1 SDR family oxidoreductase [Clostridium lacusfryxellense]